MDSGNGIEMGKTGWQLRRLVRVGTHTPGYGRNLNRPFAGLKKTFSRGPSIGRSGSESIGSWLKIIIQDIFQFLDRSGTIGFLLIDTFKRVGLDGLRGSTKVMEIII